MLFEDNDAPDYTRLLRRLKQKHGVVRVINDASLVDYELLSLATCGKEDVNTLI